MLQRLQWPPEQAPEEVIKLQMGCNAIRTSALAKLDPDLNNACQLTSEEKPPSICYNTHYSHIPALKCVDKGRMRFDDTKEEKRLWQSLRSTVKMSMT